MMKFEFVDEIFNLSLNKNIDEEVEKIFNFYRHYGFPNYSKNDYDIAKEYTKLSLFDEKSLLNEDKSIKQNMLGLGILWSYFPHWIEVECGNSISLQEAWNNDNLLKECIKKTYLWKCKHNEPHWTNNRIRQNAKVFLAKQSVSNFRPTVAKFIYNNYGSNGTVIDMSSGYGGRLFGFFASNCSEYIGFEPCTKTFNGLNDLGKDLQNLSNKKFKINYCGSENYLKEYENVSNLCFKSPPYFDTEHYSDEDTQSYIKYPSIDLWINGFLKETIVNCYYYLKSKGYLILNIANTPKYNNIESDTIRLATSIGFTYVDTLKMELSSVAKNKGRKYEPIFIFQKP